MRYDTSMRCTIKTGWWTLLFQLYGGTAKKNRESGAHGDMNAHIVDLARYLVGEFEAVTGEQRVFVKERPIQDSDHKGEVNADDATSFMARFQNGAIGSFSATRMATGRKNFMQFELFGSKGGAHIQSGGALMNFNTLMILLRMIPKGSPLFWRQNLHILI